MGSIEPCIYPVDSTKRHPPGFQVRKYVRDLGGDERQVSKIFRPVDDSEEAREEALQRARDFVREIESEKRTGEIHRRLKNSTSGVGYGIAWHEYTEREQQKINEELRDDFERRQEEARREAAKGRETFSEFMSNHLEWYEANTSKSNFQKKRAAWSAVKTFAEKTGRRIVEKKIGEIRPSEVDEFAAWLSSRKKSDGSFYYSKSSVKGYFALVRSFFKSWAAEEGKQNPATPERLKTDVARLRGREATEKVPEPERMEKVEKGIEQAIEAAKRSFGGRYLHLRIILRYIHRMLCGTGMRISEALFLTVDHVDFDEMTIRIEGAVVDGEPGLTKTGKRKGSKEAGTRIIPMSEAVADTIREWLELREEHGYPAESECNTIFCRRDGTYYTDDQIRSYYKHACSKVKKLEGHIVPHQVRHWFNDRLRRAGVSSEVREAMLGHADAETNAGYTSVKALECRSVLNN